MGKVENKFNLKISAKAKAVIIEELKRYPNTEIVICDEFCERCGKKKERIDLPLCLDCYYEDKPQRFCLNCGKRITYLPSNYDFCEKCFQKINK